jgi:hypothetical protein
LAQAVKNAVSLAIESLFHVKQRFAPKNKAQRNQLANLPTFPPSNLPTFQPSNLQTFKPSDLQTFRPSNFPTRKPNPCFT